LVKPWRRALRDSAVSGSAASVLSSVALALCGKRERSHPAAPTNATSHWVWGDEAFRRDRPSVRYTLIGYGIHHAASIFWATLYERALAAVGAPSPAMKWGAVGAVAALAYFVDFRLTPRRLTPGFEKRLSRRSIIVVYSAFAAGLALGNAVQQKRR
jgi:hypothetical protein